MDKATALYLLVEEDNQILLMYLLIYKNLLLNQVTRLS
jgi:hypothetical protein